MKVGDYVRTKQRTFQYPQIVKITNMEKDSGYKNQYYIELDHNLIPDYKFHIYEEDVDLSSPNIIDLIEVGDYVNGYRVIDFDYSIANTRIRIWIDTENERNYICKNEIKSIVTKEQFESMKYEVGE